MQPPAADEEGHDRYGEGTAHLEQDHECVAQGHEDGFFVARTLRAIAALATEEDADGAANVAWYYATVAQHAIAAGRVFLRPSSNCPMKVEESHNRSL